MASPFTLGYGTLGEGTLGYSEDPQTEEEARLMWSVDPDTDFHTHNQNV